MRIHAVVAVLAIILGVVFRIHAYEWLAVLLCIGAVMSLECLNTALEALVDLVSPEYNDTARIAKDCAAAAVLLAAVISVVVACVVYIPHMLNMIQ